MPNSFVGGPPWRQVPRTLRGGVSAATLQTFLDKAIAALEAGTLDGRDDTIFRWMPVSLDPQGWQEVVAIMEEATNKILASHLRSQDRLAQSGAREEISTVVGRRQLRDGGVADRLREVGQLPRKGNECEGLMLRPSLNWMWDADRLEGRVDVVRAAS